VHTKHEFLPPELFFRFSQRTCPIHYFRSKTHVWGGFAQFRCRTSPILKTVVGGAYKARVFVTGTISLFFAMNMPNPLLRSKTHVWGGFAQFRCHTSDEDIHTTDTSMPIQVPISSPITRARARQLNHQVITLLSSCPSYLDHGDPCTLVLLEPGRRPKGKRI
jgi:hypothetical protein